jgi:hypothetical protein
LGPAQLPEDEQRERLDEYARRQAMSSYQNRLPITIRTLTSTLLMQAYLAEFDDDAKRKEYKEELVKLAQLSEEEAGKLNVAKRPGQGGMPTFESVMRAARDVHGLWPDQHREYVQTVKHIAFRMRPYESDQDVQDTLQQMFDHAAGLQTVYPGIPTDRWLWTLLLSGKKDVLEFLLARQPLNTRPGNWLALAKVIGGFKGEFVPDYAEKSVPPIEKQFESAETEAERAEASSSLHRRNMMTGYHDRLPPVIQSLTTTLLNGAHLAEFDDDAKRAEYKEALVELAQLSKEEAGKLDVEKRANPDTPAGK